MSGAKLILTYSLRLVVREWRRFVLPFLSLGITAVVMVLILLLSNASTLLLDQQAQELLGGDIVIESTTEVSVVEIWKTTGLQPEAESQQLSFSGTLQSPAASAPFSVKVIDRAYPLYGTLTLAGRPYIGISAEEILLDAAGAERLQVAVGDTVSFGSRSYTLAGIIATEPTSLLGGFQFLPRAILSQDGFAGAGVEVALLRAEYVYAAKVAAVSAAQIEALQAVESSSRGVIDVDIAGENRTGLQRGVQIVADFLVVAVLITSVLAAVNVYASTLYLVTVERKSLAILLALGLTKRRLVLLLGAALGYVVLLASALGVLLGIGLFRTLTSLITQWYAISLPTPNIILYALLSVLLIATIALASFVPAIKRTLSLNPKQVLIGGEEELSKRFPLRTLILLTSSTLIPLIALASFLLNSFSDGLLVIGVIALVYVSIAGLFSLVLQLIYTKRARFSFYVRSIISQKKADGLFGVVSFTSLFVALTALSTLALLQISLERYLTQDLTRTVPTTYVLDIQPSQKDVVLTAFPDLELFASIPARIIAIDAVRIQDELAQASTEVDRELGREFNITARNELLTSEDVSAGVWGAGRPGEISVDEDFAKRANIKLGSTLTFSIQGFEVSGSVTSLRTTDSRSGLPFFYFVLSPEDIGQFPGVYFGYSYYEAAEQKALGKFLADEAPNVSVLETQALGPLIISLVSTLMVMVLIVTLPPLLIATLLIATLVVSSYASRRREGARLRALGATRQSVLKQYLGETVSLTLAAAIFAYGLSMIFTYAISAYFFQLDATALFDLQLLSGLGLIVLLVGLIGLYLFKTDTIPLRELLSYGENS